MINIFACISIAICAILFWTGNSSWWQSVKILPTSSDASDHKSSDAEQLRNKCEKDYIEYEGVREYTDIDGRSRSQPDFVIYRTAAKKRLRVPPEEGALRKPNNLCEMETGSVRFKWSEEKLLPIIKKAEGTRNTAGLLVEYFMRFSPPSEKKTNSKKLREWFLEGAFPVPENNRILVLPFAGYYSAELVPKQRNNRELWKPRLLLLDALDQFGNPLIFHCYRGLVINEVNGVTQVRVALPKYGPAQCSGYLLFMNGGGGRLDIHEYDFIKNGTKISNAVFKRANGYIMQE